MLTVEELKARESSLEATAHVLEDAKLLNLEKSKLRGLILRYPELSLGLLRGLSMRLRATNLAVSRK